MADPPQIVYTDDPDAFVAWTITDELGQNLDWASPEIRIGGGIWRSATWQGTAAPTREIRLAMANGLSLRPRKYTAYLKVPNGNDLELGKVEVVVMS